MSKPEELVGWPVRYLRNRHGSSWTLLWIGMPGKIVGTVMLGGRPEPAQRLLPIPELEQDVLKIPVREYLVWQPEPPADLPKKKRAYLATPFYVDVDELEFL